MKPHILIMILYHPSNCMFSWHHSSFQSHNSNSFKTRHTLCQKTKHGNTKNTTAITVFGTSQTYISKHLLIQYGLLGANDLRLARLENGAKRRTQKEPGVIQSGCLSLNTSQVPSQQSQQQRFILWINRLVSITNLIHNSFILSPLSTGALYSRLQRVTIPDAVTIQFDLRMSIVLLETCWGL
jgi:hypothetical protein